MTNLETSSNKPAALSNWLPITFLILSAIGFADATYLTIQHFLRMPVACSVVHGCEIVLTSRFSTIGPIPISLLGSAYYLTILVLSVAYLDSKKTNVLNLAAKLTPVGFLTSLILVYLQIFVIHAICLYCAGSAITSTLLFIVAIVYLRKNKKTSQTSL